LQNRQYLIEYEKLKGKVERANGEKNKEKYSKKLKNFEARTGIN